MKKFLKRLLIVVIIALVLVIAELVYKINLNTEYVKEYYQGIYKEDKIKIVSIIKLYEGYIPDYNYGLYYYRNGDFILAELRFQEALKQKIPKERVCDVRINAALSALAQITENTKIQKETEILKRAKGYLEGYNCFTEKQPGGSGGGDGNLEDDINDELGQNEEESGGASGEDGNQEGENGNQQGDSGSGMSDQERQNYEGKLGDINQQNQDSSQSRNEQLEQANDQEGAQQGQGQQGNIPGQNQSSESGTQNDEINYSDDFYQNPNQNYGWGYMGGPQSIPPQAPNSSSYCQGRCW